jgi:hypothetical protein
MRPKRYLVLAAFITVAVFSVATYSACNKNKCHNVVCLNNGACFGGTCKCPTGFEGNRCQTLSRDKFIYNYNGYDLCGDSSLYHPYSVQLLAVLHDSTEMVLRNLLDNLDDSAICTIQSTDSFTFIGSNNSTTFTGVGHLSNDSLWLYYHVVHDTTSYDCKYFGQSLR